MYNNGAGGTEHLCTVIDIDCISLKPAKMNFTELKGNWNEFKGKLKQKYAELTDDDLMYEEGKDDELYGKIQQRLGKTKDEVRKIIAEL